MSLVDLSRPRGQVTIWGELQGRTQLQNKDNIKIYVTKDPFGSPGVNWKEKPGLEQEQALVYAGN